MKKKLFSRVGQSLVEFALVLSIFLMILLGTIDFGFYLYSLTVLDMAVRDGVRTSVTFSDWSANQESRTSEIRDLVIDRAALLPRNIQSGLRNRVFVSFDPDVNAPVSVTVEVRNHPFQPLSGFLGIILPHTISTRATMRHEH